MAKQRINPDFDPTRIVQPTANPVDTYYRNNLVAPDVGRQLQIAKALQDLNPQLQRLTSDVASFSISKQIEAGALEAQAAPTQEILMSKAAQYIEKAGGLAPWRYQSFLKATGDRLTRDNYQSKLYENIEDLTDPTNPDGTLRGADYMTTRMQELFKEAGIPEDSFYITQGALEAKAKADETFMNRAVLIHAEKVKTKGENDLKDKIFFALKTTPVENLDELFAFDGPVRGALDTFHAQGFGSGDEQLVSAIKDWADVLESSHDFDGARSVIKFLMENNVGNRKIGDRYTPMLQKKLDDLDETQQKYAVYQTQLRQTEQNAAMSDAMDVLMGRYQQMQADRQKKGLGNFINMSVDQRMQWADETLSKLNYSADAKRDAKSRIVEALRVFENEQNQPSRPNPAVTAALLQEAYTADRKELLPKLIAQVSQGNMGIGEMRSILDVNAEAASIQGSSSAIGQILGNMGFNDGTWTGYAKETVSPDYRVMFEQLGADAQATIYQRILAETTSQEFKQKYSMDPVGKQQAVLEIARRVAGEERKRLIEDNKDKIEGADMTQSFNTVWSQEYDTAAERLAANYVATLEMNPKKDDSYGIVRNIMFDYKARMKAVWEDLSAPRAGQRPLSMTEKRERLSSEVQRIERELLSDLKNPKTVKALTPEQVNMMSRPAPSEIPQGMPGVTAQPGEAGSAVTSRNWALFGGNLSLTPQESSVATLAKDIRSRSGTISATSSASDKAAFDQSKADLQATAADAIKAFNTVSLREYNIRHGRGWVGGGGDRPAIQIRPDGLYVDQYNPLSFGPTNPPVLDRRITEQYWVYKSILGYTPDELAAGKTVEGLTIEAPMLDPNSFLFFTSPTQFQQAVDEYLQNKGTKGFIAEQVLPKLTPYGTTFAEFKDSQMRLLQVRKPLK